jgi:hypothetical protein
MIISVGTKRRFRKRVSMLVMQEKYDSMQCKDPAKGRVLVKIHAEEV